MKVKVLGCSGSIAKDCRTTSFLIDHDVLIDAGTGVGDLSLEDMCRIDDVFLSHAHLDHIVSLPLMLDSVGALRSQPLRVHALGSTLAALKTHIFNNVIWPDFTVIPSADAPFITLHEIELGQTCIAGGKYIEILPAVHAVPAVGFAVATIPANKDAPTHWVFSGDTERNPAFWQRVNQLQVGMLVIETTFSNNEKELAKRSRHLCAEVLLQELQHIEQTAPYPYPIYITHAKPAEIEAIMQEIEQLNHAAVLTEAVQPTTMHPANLLPTSPVSPSAPRLHQIARLQIGQEFAV